MISGDAYLGSSNPNDFAYWGRNLTQSSGTQSASPDSFWGLNNYSNNVDSIAKLSGSEYTKYAAKVASLQGEASLMTTSQSTEYQLGLSNYYLSRSDITNGAASDQSGQYPEGKIWVIKRTSSTQDLRITQSFSYHGKGTIIVTGNLTIDPGVKITPADSNSKLGFIVQNNTTFGGNNRVWAAILSLGSSGFIFGGNNIDLVGSFVGFDFNFYNWGNIRFFYDKSLNDNWPPGFGDLNMPYSAEN
jgi:hypothetical protein